MNQFSYSSKLFNTEPKEKIIFGMSVLCICLILNSMWVSSIVIVIMGIITITNSKKTIYSNSFFAFRNNNDCDSKRRVEWI